MASAEDGALEAASRPLAWSSAQLLGRPRSRGGQERTAQAPEEPIGRRGIRSTTPPTIGPMGSPLPTGLEASPACPLPRPDLGPGLDDLRIAAALAELGRDPAAPALVLFGSRARGEARPSSDLDLLLIVAGALTSERERALRSRARALLTPVLPVDLDLLITDAATAAHWAGSRWHVLGHIHREGRPLHAA
jgi:predicted nucleotidyltransferase